MVKIVCQSGVRLICFVLGVSIALATVADDRALFYLKGPVKTAIFDTVLSFQSFPANESVTRSFSEDGTLLPNDDLGDMTVVRESDSVTFKYVSWKGNHRETFLLTSDGRLKGFKGTDEMGDFQYFISGENGDITLETITVTSPAGTKTYSVGAYKVLERDKYGNWTRRKAVINKSYVREETCRITYYE
ncbi:hypothetical protein [Xylanibacter muris]|uniref:Allene oxide cyclase barrel-like domain-containing protein n=1 Tax=Xylanibacter muris TaxID=2736290 RepID=A0ABX2ALJ4_9BACT|nr:hypothetical protein [Xylanibacter muris]NPD91472.1 hypothetical protein [Xylanibacter muris]